jgi:hypothetical protein
MRPVRAGDDLESGRHVVKLIVIQEARKIRTDAAQVRSRRGANSGAAGFREARVDHAVVGRAPVPDDQLAVDQAIHDSGEAARWEHRALGELGHLQVPTRCACKSHEHVIVAQADVVLVPQLDIELLGNLLMRVQQGLPRVELEVA